MKRSTKIMGSTTGLMAAAAFAGLISGASSHAVAATNGAAGFHARSTVVASAGAKARNLDDSSTQATHDCKGKNSCKGQGGCNTGDQGCKGKNSCQGKGGCKTNGSI
jgi:hypothetical protein